MPRRKEKFKSSPQAQTKKEKFYILFAISQ